MKRFITFFSAILLVGFVFAQDHPVIYSTNISESNVDLEVTDPVVLGQIDFDATTSGVALVRFEGKCISSEGDLIGLAASNSTTIEVDEKNVSLEAVSTDVNNTCFSHSMLYDVSAGSNTFYALAKNAAEVAGDGKASIYGTFTVKFFPNGITYASVVNQPIKNSLLEVEDGIKVKLDSLTISPLIAGKVVLSYSGTLLGAVGKRVMMAASDSVVGLQNENQVSMQNVSDDLNRRSFSFTRTFDVSPGEKKFYAITKVTGSDVTKISVYGSMVAEFYPETDLTPRAVQQGIQKQNLDVTETEAFDSVVINAPVPGKVYLRFDGYGYISVGDRIILAASDNIDWGTNDGAVSIEALNNDIIYVPFCHSRVYDVDAGEHKFYAVSQNYVETDGNHKVSAYANLTAEYFPDSVSFKEPLTGNSLQAKNKIIMYPNPATTKLTIDFTGITETVNSFEILDITGKTMEISNLVSENMNTISIDISKYPNGMYMFRIYTNKDVVSGKFIKN